MARLEFETFPGRADIQISKKMTTPEGDEIRAIVTTGGNVFLTGVGKRSDEVIILDGFPPEEGENVASWDTLWDALRTAAAAVAGALAKKECKSTVVVEQDAKTGKTTTTFQTVCS